MDYAKESLKKHYKWRGKIEIACRVPLETRRIYPLRTRPVLRVPH